MGFSWSGVTQQQKESGNLAPLIFGLALLMVFLFLAAQYESWATPFSVLLSVPLAILGAIIFTVMRGFDNNIYTQIGFVLLIGMSAKNAILIVEFAKQQRDDEGKSIIEAAREAAQAALSTHPDDRSVVPLGGDSAGRWRPVPVPTAASASAPRSSEACWHGHRLRRLHDSAPLCGGAASSGEAGRQESDASTDTCSASTRRTGDVIGTDQNWGQFTYSWK